MTAKIVNNKMITVKMDATKIQKNKNANFVEDYLIKFKSLFIQYQPEKIQINFKNNFYGKFKH
jgi:hypothetical protein